MYGTLKKIIMAFFVINISSNIGNSSAADDVVTFNQSSYEVDVSTHFSSMGDHLVTLGVSFNRSVIKNVTINSYGTFGSNRNIVRISPDGRVFLSHAIRNPGVVSVSIGAFIEVEKLDGERVIENINTGLKIFVKGLLYFQSNPLYINISEKLPVHHFSYNLTKQLVPSVKTLEHYELIYQSEPSDYLVSTHDGILTLKHGTGLDIGIYDVVVLCSYDVTLDNGTFVVDLLSLSVKLSVFGCKGGLQGILEWPTLSPCEMTKQPCSQFASFLEGGDIVQHCNHYGKWAVPDFSQCSLNTDRINTNHSFAVTWFKVMENATVEFDVILDRIQHSVRPLFPNGLVLNVTLLVESTFESQIVTFVKLSKVVSDSEIKTIYHSFSSLSVLGNIPLSHEKYSSGLRLFIPSSDCSEYRYLLDGTPNLIHICMKTSGLMCNCSNVSMIFDEDCKEEYLTIPDYNVTYTHSSDTSTSVIFQFSQKKYKKTMYFNEIHPGMNLITVSLNITNDHSLLSYSDYYGIHGYESRLFHIGHSNGIIKLVKALGERVQHYSFIVTCYYEATFKNGTTLHDSISTTVLIIFENAVEFKEPIYTLYVNSDISPADKIANISNFVRIRPHTFHQLQLQFHVLEYSKYPNDIQDMPVLPFKLSSTGILSRSQDSHLSPHSEYTVVIALTATGIDVHGKHFTMNDAATNFLIKIRGCQSIRDGTIVWPVLHPCGIAIIKCSDFDRESFTSQGIIRRQCSYDGKWLPLDFSSCTFHRNVKPFIIVWVSLYDVWTWDAKATFFIMRDLRRIMTGYPLESLSVHGIQKLNDNYRKAIVQSFKVVLVDYSPVSEDQLLQLRNNISMSNYIGGILTYKFKGSSGVMGFRPTDSCRIGEHFAELQYTRVCRMNSKSTCDCHPRPAVSAPCCSNDGDANHNQTCVPKESTVSGKENITTKGDLNVQLKCSVDVGSRYVYLQWKVQTNVKVKQFIVAYVLAGISQKSVIVKGSQRNVNITGLLPASVYELAIKSEADHGSSSTTTACSHTVLTQNDYPVSGFQLILSSTHADCSTKAWKEDTKLLLQKLSDSIARECQCDFSSHKFGDTFSRCQHYDSESHITIASWIYGQSGDPSSHYLDILQQMCKRRLAYTVNSHVYILLSTCMADFKNPNMFACNDNSEVSIASYAENDQGKVSMTVAIIIPIIFCVVTFILVTSLNCAIQLTCFKTRRSGFWKTATCTKLQANHTTSIPDDEAVLEHEF